MIDAGVEGSRVATMIGRTAFLRWKHGHVHEGDVRHESLIFQKESLLLLKNQRNLVPDNHSIREMFLPPEEEGGNIDLQNQITMYHSKKYI